MGLRICNLFQTLKFYFEIYPTAVSLNRPPKMVNNFEYLYKHIFILEKEALETLSVKLNYRWKILTLNK
jgi:hypothetical protein